MMLSLNLYYSVPHWINHIHIWPNLIKIYRCEKRGEFSGSLKVIVKAALGYCKTNYFLVSVQTHTKFNNHETKTLVNTLCSGPLFPLTL